MACDVGEDEERASIGHGDDIDVIAPDKSAGFEIDGDLESWDVGIFGDESELNFIRFFEFGFDAEIGFCFGACVPLGLCFVVA